MNLVETSYKALLQCVRDYGVHTSNRTGIDTTFIPSGTIVADMRQGFPLMGLRRLFWKGGTAEAQGFLRGYDNAADFEALGCKFWTANANNPSKGSNTSDWLSSSYRRGENDLGEIYGVQWRKWKTSTGMVIDQILEALALIKNSPQSRRIMVASWNPEVVLEQKAALPPCHDSWVIQIDQKNKLMHLSWRQRSTDLILGTPTNLVCYGFILQLLAHLCGYTAGFLTGHLDNVHIYENHTHAVQTLIERSSRQLPTLVISSEVPKAVSDIYEQLHWLETIDNTHLSLVNYIPHDGIDNLPMAV